MKKTEKSKKIGSKILNLSFLALLLALVFVPEVKATFQQGLMKLGFFKPRLESSNMQAHTSSATNGFNLTLKDYKGNLRTLADLNGKVVFINFWATWCPPCIAEMPSIHKLYNTFKNNEKVAFIILEVDGNEQKALQFMQKKGLDLPVYFPAGSIPKALFNGTLPTTVILDKKGQIAHTTQGMADYSGPEMVDFINQLLNK